MKALIRVVVCGSVDDGKSTLLGRLLAETGSIPEDQLESARFTRRPGSTIPLGEIDYSLVTDGLEAERGRSMDFRCLGHGRGASPSQAAPQDARPCERGEAGRSRRAIRMRSSPSPSEACPR